jgi:hypothetical protein
MDQSRFDALTRVLSDVFSRRRVLRGVAAAGLGLAAARRHEFAHANKKRVSSPKKQKPNAFGCLSVGDACRRAGQCCSGLCQGKKGRRKCRAHDTGNCLAGEHPGECLGANVACITSLGKQGVCATTTGNAAYCTSSFIECFNCKTDADCQAVDGGALGPRAACIRCADCGEINGTACAAPDVPQTM